MVFVTNNIVPNGVLTCVSTSGDGFGKLAVFRQAVNQLTVSSSTCIHKCLSLAGVSQRLCGGSSTNNSNSCLNAPTQLDFAGVVISTLYSQLISTNIGRLIAGHSIGDSFGDGNGLGLFCAGIGQRTTQLHICLSNGLGIDGHSCIVVIDDVVAASSQRTLPDGIAANILTCSTLQFTSQRVIVLQTNHCIGQFGIGITVGLADCICGDGNRLGIDNHSDGLGVTLVVGGAFHGVGDRVSACVHQISSGFITDHSTEIGGCGG